MPYTGSPLRRGFSMMRSVSPVPPSCFPLGEGFAGPGVHDPNRRPAHTGADHFGVLGNHAETRTFVAVFPPEKALQAEQKNSGNKMREITPMRIIKPPPSLSWSMLRGDRSPGDPLPAKRRGSSSRAAPYLR